MAGRGGYVLGFLLALVLWAGAGFVAVAAAPPPPAKPAAAAADFASPEDALAALEAALKADDVAALDGIFGPASQDLVHSGDPVADREARRRFLESFETAHRLQAEGDDRRMLIVGANDWPMPIPLVRSGGRWHFDSDEGAQAIIDRRIGENEIAAIRSLLIMADGQRAYFELRHEYARRFLSSPGKQDGLYWPVAEDEPPSPLADLAADAEDEGYSLDPLGGPRPFRGYRFRILTGQGPSAPGGAKSYMEKQMLSGGFALLAWPASYGVSGIMTFQVGPDGIVFQKDLGPQTTDAAARMTRFDPDLSWARIDIKD